MTHTPGPWIRNSGWEPCTGVIDVENIYGEPPAGVVAKVVRAAQDGQYTAEKESNARLIAAAPALLAACRDAEGYMTDVTRDYTHLCDDHPLLKIRAAIAAATGDARVTPSGTGITRSAAGSQPMDGR